MKCVRTDPETNCPRLTCPPSSSSVSQIIVLTTVPRGTRVTRTRLALTYKQLTLVSVTRAFRETAECTSMSVQWREAR
nr:unnamed protein product [Callosobruchus chinensis]